MSDNFLLIDGSNLAFRMFFALEMSNLRDAEGNPTWAIYGTLKALFDVIEATEPTHIAACFDMPVPSFRHEMFEDYKANRPDEMPEDLKVQWGVIKDAIAKFGITVMEEPGFEADDLIGIMAYRAEQAGSKAVVLSGDKDLFQLVSDKTTIAMPKRGGGLEFYDHDKVVEKMGVTPEQVPDYKGIAGDSSDNIPGVKGLGPKAAITLLGKYGTLEKIYEAIDEVGPPKTKEKLVTQEESARLSKHLATIIKEADLKGEQYDVKESALSMPNVEELTQFLQRLEFRTILQRLPIILKPFNGGDIAEVNGFKKTDFKDNPYTDEGKNKPEKKSEVDENKWDKLDTPYEELKIDFQTIKSESELDSVVLELEKAQAYAIDFETDGLNTNILNVVGLAFAYKLDASKEELKSLYIPFMHEGEETLEPEFIWSKLKAVLEDESKLQIIQNLKFEHKILQRHGIKLHKNVFDTMLASYVQNPANKHGLKTQSKRVFHTRMVEIEDLIGTGRKQIKINEAPLEKVSEYASADAYITYRLYDYYLKTLDEREKKLLTEIEFPLISVLADIETKGISLNKEYFAELSIELDGMIAEITARIYEICDVEFNISSPKQLSDVLYNKLEFPVIGKKKKTGAYSTDMKTMEAFLEEYKFENPDHVELVKKIIDYRTYTKLKSTYVDNLPTLIDKSTGRLHTDFNQVVTATGRLSSSNPNLQNIPIRTEFGRKVRAGFVAKDDEHIFVSADYSQVELRVLAHMAGEQALIDAFNKNQDIHKRTASEIFEVELDEVDDDQRRVGKTLNFALIYMQGPFATAKQLGITMSEAKEFTNKYFAAFKKIKPFMDETLQFAHDNEYVETMFGRRRFFKNINSRNKILAKEEERQAFNAGIQGTAADIMKMAMINLHHELKNSDLRGQVLLQVHDELVLEVHKEDLSAVKELVLEKMQNAIQLEVPLLVDISEGQNWLEAK